MKKFTIFLFLGLLYQIPCYAVSALGGIDIFQDGINNPTGWVQPTRSYKYTVGADGVSLYHNRQKLPITLNTPATPGTTRSVTDYAIAPRAATGATAAAAGRNTGGGNTGGGNAGGGNAGAGNTGGGNTGGGNTGAGNTGAGNTGGGNTGGGNTGGGNTGGGNTGAGNTGAGNTGGGNAGAGNTGGGNTGTGNTGTGNNTTSNTTPKKGATALKTAGAVVVGALGAYGIYENTKGQDEHTATNVAGGATSGLLGGMSVGALWGVKGGWIGAAIGAAAGGLFAGSQLFSETDCLHDPITGQFTCCNTLFNQGERQAAIGDYMFCGTEPTNDTPTQPLPPGVRQCLQGGSQTEFSWWDGLWEDDGWSAECVVRYCDNEPPANTMVVYTPDTENYCWNWRPAEPGEDGTVVTDDGENVKPSDQYSVLIYRLKKEIQAYEKKCGQQQ